MDPGLRAPVAPVPASAVVPVGHRSAAGAGSGTPGGAAQFQIRSGLGSGCSGARS